ncbi:hypothetical protein SAY86_019117 [Trapa natans]|uniref:POX domain-containing protein n=1 Tax=Trapa natans TaxID=22666 RepID=A0AAN7LHJ1_TRANT|nr:hypothetical protein SAY86_019117 [Trapa natans]
MGIENSPTPEIVSAYFNELNSSTSMSESNDQLGVFSFANWPTSASASTFQIGREKLREQQDLVPPAAGIGGGGVTYEPTGMLSEMLGYPLSGGRAATGDLQHAFLHSYRAGHVPIMPAPVQFPTWLHESSLNHNLSQGSYQGLSLSLSSSLNQLEAPKVEEQPRVNGIVDGGLMTYSNDRYTYRSPHSGGEVGPAGFPGAWSSSPSSTLGVTLNALRNSRYSMAARDLLDEFCCVSDSAGMARMIRRQKLEDNSNPSQINLSAGGGGNGAGGSSSTTSKDVPPLSAADRAELQRRKSKLLTMLDEAYLKNRGREGVERRYNHYREQMYMVVSSFDMVMGLGASLPYTKLAQKAMSRHFRCLKDAVAADLRTTCERLGEKDADASSGPRITKGETPRLKLLEQSWRQQRAFHQMGMVEQEGWRPQRGLPERSVSILRSWLFEHFLNPYQTGS